MFSVILIDIKNKLNIKDYLSFIKTLNGDFETIYCSSTPCNNAEIKNIIFQQNENVEKIINAVFALCNQKNVIVVRDVLEYKKIKQLIENKTTKNQIVCFESVKNKLYNRRKEV